MNKEKYLQKEILKHNKKLPRFFLFNTIFMLLIIAYIVLVFSFIFTEKPMDPTVELPFFLAAGFLLKNTLLWIGIIFYFFFTESFKKFILLIILWKKYDTLKLSKEETIVAVKILELSPITTQKIIKQVFLPKAKIQKIIGILQLSEIITIHGNLVYQIDAGKID